MSPHLVLAVAVAVLIMVIAHPLLALLVFTATAGLPACLAIWLLAWYNRRGPVWLRTAAR